MSPQVSPIENISEERQERIIQKCPSKSNKSLQQNKVETSKKPAVCKMMHSAKRAPMQSRKANIPLQVKAKRPLNIMHSKTSSTAPARKREKEKGLKVLFEILHNHASHCLVLKQALEDAGFLI